MASSFGGINTALSSLYAQRRGLDVTGQNIANANTEGYTRQRVDMQSQVGSISPAMWSKTDGLGTGVGVSSVQRLRDEYLENRGRAEHANSAKLSSQSAAYAAIEDVFAEPGDTALAAQLRDMWGGWNDVANNPQTSAARSALIQQSATVADGLNRAHASLSGQWSQNHTQLKAYVSEVNTTAQSIAQLNDTIVKATATGLTVNELEDRRDLQIMQLAKLTGATASKRENGAVDVFIDNAALVTGTRTRQLTVAGADQLGAQSAQPVRLAWTDTGTAAQAGGTMGAMVETLTALIPDKVAQLDGIALKLATQVNTVHRTGYSADGSTGLDFFGTQPPGGAITAAAITVVVEGQEKVAFSNAAQTLDDGSTVGTLDGSIADRIAAVGDSPQGPDRTYQEMIGELGVVAQASNRRAEIQAVVTEQVDASREAYSGVNLDEEMVNLLTYQRGYEAASRVLTTIDSMLDQLINRTGLVGR